jgi:PEP-CTERM motif
MKKWLLVAALTFLPSFALALPSIVFDTVPGGAGGTLTYDGAGGPLVGTDVQFVNLVGIESPLNANVVLSCVDCFLDFTTGANTLEGPPLYTWAGGGSFVLTGDVPALGLDDAILLSGSFTGTPNTPGLAASGASALFIALGVDTKNETLANFYGFTPDGWAFANTEIALGTFAPGADGAFSAIPNQADLINAVPEPSTWLLLGTGLLAFAPMVRRIRR